MLEKASRNFEIEGVSLLIILEVSLGRNNGVVVGWCVASFVILGVVEILLADTTPIVCVLDVSADGNNEVIVVGSRRCFIVAFSAT